MFKSIALFALALAPSAAFAATPATEIVSDDGVRFEYSTRLSGEDVLIEGRTIESGEDFHLVVRPSGRVHGNFGPASVEYKVSKSRRDRLVEKLRAKPEYALAQNDAPSAN
jgi:hypothetical protein